ncbi:MAG TPA: SurA N-terminal domain-containing protein [Dongiaceae bacterium]|nr:SurA N-terminal domain-containing protein [Dongiaceae bacterium]
MKKVIAKLRARKQPKEPEGRITTDTLAEHRERVLAGGRKFKYPVQYARHKLVINAIIISAAAVLFFIALGWYLLYPAQNNSDFMYRVTKVVPVPVAIIDGQQVRYSDYLMKYRSAAHYLVEKEQIDTKSEDGKRQLDYVKSQAMADAVADAYAVKLARQLNITVSDSDLQAYLKQQRQSSDGEVSESTYDSVIMDYYGWSPDEYQDAMRSKLLRQEVSYAIDTNASSRAKEVESKISSGTTDLKAITDTLNAENQGAAEYGTPAWVPRNNQDGGLALAAAKLQKGQVSTAVKSTTDGGYYYVKLIDSNDSQIEYEYIHIPLTKFSTQLKEVENSGKLTKFIAVSDVTQQ